MAQRRSSREADEERRPIRSRRGGHRSRDEEAEAERDDEQPADQEEEYEPPADGQEGEGDDEQPAAAKEDSRLARTAHDGMNAADAARAAVRSLAELIGKRPEGITEVQPTDDGWLVGVEVVEDRRVPSSSDILAIYEAELGPDGSLLSYRRSRRYPRGRSDSGEGG